MDYETGAVVIAKWVDFHYKINGKMYEFSLPGGGFVSFENLIEVLGIVDGTNFESAADFVAQVEDVEFSSPELVDVSKVDADTTVGQIKESRGLECQYSAELTEEQIAKINAQTVDAGDWALISLQPFTSEESLTVTMKNGDQFVVMVMDAQIKTTYMTATGETYEITVTYGEDAGIPDGAMLEVNEIEVGTAEWQNYYDQAAAASGNDALAFARFFDICIMDGDVEIEPQAQVITSIEYESTLPLNPDSNPKAVHFAEDGVEVLDVVMDDEEFASKFTFEQGSFSVTGTTVSELADGQYLIIGYNVSYNGTTYHDKSYTNNEDWAYKGVTSFSTAYRALQYSNNNLGVNSDMDGGYGRPRYTGNNDSRVLWTVTKSGDGYLISLGNRYLRNNNGNLTTTTNSSQASVWTYSNGQLRNGSHYLWFDGNSFSLTTTQPTGENIYFVWNNSSTSGNITIHYMLDNGDGTYTQTSTTTKSLQDSSLVKGDQYDLRSGIPSGMQYQKTVLSNNSDNSTFDGSGTQIHYYLQTNYGLTDSALPAINYRGWLYRETTDWDFDYGVSGWPSNGGIAVSSVSAYRTFGDEKDIYVIYRQPPASSGTVNPGDVDAEDPKIEKNKSTNTNSDGTSDGTYDLSLSVTGSAKSSSATSRANVAVVLDLSYSMLTQDTGTTGESRLDACKVAIQSLANQLFALNTANPGTIEAAYIGFAQRVLNEREINNTYFDETSFMAAVNKSTTAAGTNWDAALEAVNNIQWSDGDPVYVIFITDGQPNGFSNRDIAGNGNSYASSWDSGNYAINSTSATSGSVLSPAAQITALQNSGATVYGIGAWFGAADAYYLNNINIPAANVSRADNTTQLNTQMTNIVSTISSSVGYEDIQVTDGITDLTSTALIKGTAGNFRYEVAKYNFDSDGKKTTKIDGTEATITVNNDDTVTITFPDGTSDTVNQAGYTASSNTVTWNMGSTYHLRDGYTYTVSFTVWPGQVAYDLLADLNNGISTWVDATETEPAKIVYDNSVDDSILPVSGQRVYGKDYTDQIDKSGNSYSLKTNVDTGNTVKYTKVKTVTQNGQTTTTRIKGESNFINPDPMPLENTTLGLEKKWDDATDNSQRPGSVNLDLYMGTEVYLDDLTLSNANNWTKDALTIAPGLMVSTGHNAYSPAWPQVTYDGVTYAILDTGHDYYFAEDPMDYHFELTAYTYHPMIINGVLWNVSFTYDDSGAITGVELINEMTNISVTNTLKGRLYVAKTVEIPEGAIGYDLKNTTFAITINLNDADGNPLSSTGTQNGSNGVIYRIQYGENHPSTDEGWTGYNATYGNYGRGPQKSITNGTFTENIYAGDVIYVGNLPEGTTYTVEENTLPVGWKLKEITYGDTEQTIAGNDEDQVTVKNTLPSFDVNILKTDQGTKPLKDAVFSLYDSSYLTDSGEVDDTATAVKTGLTSDSNGNITLGHLGGGIYYLVETKAPDGYIPMEKPVVITVDGNSTTTKDGKPLYVTYNQEGNSASVSNTGISVTENDGNYTYTLTVTNNAGYELPSTGGPGTRLFTILGSMLICLAGALLVRRRRLMER